MSASLPLDPWLTTLETSGLIRAIAVEPELEYLFRHALIQDATYSSLLKSDRRVLHQAVGETLEQLHQDRRDELAATMAYHFALAEAPRRAVDYFTRAAQRAQMIFANDEASAFYRAAIEQAEQCASAFAAEANEWHSQLARLYEQLGDVLELSGQLEAARAAYATALQCQPSATPLSLTGRQRKLGHTWALQFRHTEAMDAYAQAEQCLGSQPIDPIPLWWQEWLRIQLYRMESLYWNGQWQEIARLIEPVRPVLQQYGTPALRVYFYDSLISIEERRERFVVSETVLDYARAMLAAAQESGEIRLVADSHFQLGFCLWLHDEFEAAEAQLQIAIEIMRRIGNTRYLAYTLTYLSLLYRRRGQTEQARPYIEQAHAATRAGNITPHLAVAEGNWAWLALRVGDWESAEQHGRAAIEHWARSGFVYPFQWTAYWPLLAGAVHTNQLAHAVQYAQAMLEPTQQRLPNALTIPLTQAVQLAANNQSEAALVCLQQALTAAEQLRYL